MNSELACVLASIILADGKQEITADNIKKVLKAAGVEVKPQWPILFAQYLAEKDIMELMTSIGSAAPAQAVAAEAAPAEEKKEEKKVEEEPVIAGFAFGDSSSDDDDSDSS